MDVILSNISLEIYMINPGSYMRLESLGLLGSICGR